jgi:hypothetical protein
MANDKKQVQQPQPKNVVSINLDNTPILFTDNIFITTNADGLVLDIAQKLATSNQIRVVSRIGMSRNHAKKFVVELGRLLALTEGKSRTGSKE